MAIKTYKPTSDGRRHQVSIVNSQFTSVKPLKCLTQALIATGGRNNTGRVTSRYCSGGHKKRYRLIDFKRIKDNLEAKIISIEHDPNRSANIALIQYRDGEKKYILCPLGVSIGDTVISGIEIDIKPGNCLPMICIPLGTIIHNIEMRIGKGAQLVRSAGASAQLMAKEGDSVLVKLPSSEVRKFNGKCRASIGQISNLEHDSIKLGKAGRSRWLGVKPHVRGVAMNPVDHPMGGGEGKSSGGRHPCTPWGMPTKGFKTRKKKISNNEIVTRKSK